MTIQNGFRGHATTKPRLNGVASGDRPLKTGGEKTLPGVVLNQAVPVVSGESLPTEVSRPKSPPTARWGNRLMGAGVGLSIAYVGQSTLALAANGSIPSSGPIRLGEMAMQLARTVAQSTGSVGLGVATAVGLTVLGAGVFASVLHYAGKTLDQLVDF